VPLSIAGVVIATAAVSYFAVVGLARMRSTDVPNTTRQGAVEATGTVQATLSAEPPTFTPVATGPVPATTPTVTIATEPAPAEVPAVSALPSTPIEPSAKPTIWPAKVGAFAKNYKGAAWYPKYTPASFKIDSLDVVEMEPGTGLVCDIVYTDGTKAIQFTQGSPKARAYDIVSAGKVRWGSETADIVYEDPQDKTTPRMIVYGKGGTLAELSGDVSFDELKAVAASMIAVK